MMARPLTSRTSIPGASSTSARTAIWSAAVLAGVMGGLSFFLWQILLTSLFTSASPWATTRLIASIALGEEVARQPLMFDVTIVATAAGVHFALSILYSLAIAPVLHRMIMGRAIATGLVFGAALYVVNFYVFTLDVFPWMAEMRSWVTLVAHLLFGGVVAYTYKIAQTAQQKAIDLPEAERQARR